MKKIRTHIILLVMITLILMPVPASSQNTTNTTTIPTTTETITESPTTGPLPNTTVTTSPVNTTTTVIPTNTTSIPTATITQVPNTTAMTPVPSESPVAPLSSGNITVVSSPFGASILIDGIYYGNTPSNITGIPGGNHIIRLTMSGYYDYEGTIYVVPGQVMHVFGTLPPLGHLSIQTPSTTETPVIVTVPVTAEPTKATETLENPGVVAAIIGVITAVIGAVATVFTHMYKTKKE